MTARLAKRPVEATAVAVLGHTQTDRGMTLMEHETRCLMRGEIHELVTTDQVDARAGARIDRVGFIGFAEIEAGGVAARGDRFLLAGRPVGTLLGFDDCHFPNHLNVLIACERLETGLSLGFAPGLPVRFELG